MYRDIRDMFSGRNEHPPVILSKSKKIDKEPIIQPRQSVIQPNSGGLSARPSAQSNISPKNKESESTGKVNKLITTFFSKITPHRQYIKPPTISDEDDTKSPVSPFRWQSDGQTGKCANRCFSVGGKSPSFSHMNAHPE